MTKVQPDTEERVVIVGKDESSKTGRRERSSRLPDIARAVLFLMCLISLFATVSSASNYLRALKSARGLRLDIIGLEFIDDDNPRIVSHFRLHNTSSLAMMVGSFDFDLYLDGEWLATSQSPYVGTDPNADLAAYQETRRVSQILDAKQHLDLEFTLYFHTVRLERVRRAYDSPPLSWSADAVFRVILPFAREEDPVRLNARFEE